MTSLKGLFAVISITTFVGITGLYILEQLCFDKPPKHVQLHKFVEHDDAHNDDAHNDDIHDDADPEPYILNMQNMQNIDGDTVNNEAKDYEHTGAVQQQQQQQQHDDDNDDNDEFHEPI
jgi:hypothetical protein